MRNEWKTVHDSFGPQPSIISCHTCASSCVKIKMAGIKTSSNWKGTEVQKVLETLLQLTYHLAKKVSIKIMPNVSPTKLQSAKMVAFGSSKTPIKAVVNSTSNHFLANCWAAVNWKKTTCNTMFTVNHGSYQETPLHRSDVRYNDFHFPPEKLTAFLCAQSPHLCQYPQPASPSKDFWCQAMNVVIRDLDLNRADP